MDNLKKLYKNPTFKFKVREKKYQSKILQNHYLILKFQKSLCQNIKTL